MANLPTRTLRNYLSSLPNGASGSVLGTDLTKTIVQPARPEGYATAAQGAKADTSVQPGDLATVATSGDYDDLNGKPTLGSSAALDIASQAQAEAGVLNDKGMTPLRAREAIEAVVSVDVRAFGELGDDVVINSATVQAAIDYIEASGLIGTRNAIGKVLIPPGYFGVTGLEISKWGVTFEGAGPVASVLFNADPVAPLLTVVPPEPGIPIIGVNFENIGFRNTVARSDDAPPLIDFQGQLTKDAFVNVHFYGSSFEANGTALRCPVFLHADTMFEGAFCSCVWAYIEGCAVKIDNGPQSDTVGFSDCVWQVVTLMFMGWLTLGSGNNGTLFLNCKFLGTQGSTFVSLGRDGFHATSLAANVTASKTITVSDASNLKVGKPLFIGSNRVNPEWGFIRTIVGNDVSLHREVTALNGDAIVSGSVALVLGHMRAVHVMGTQFEGLDIGVLSCGSSQIQIDDYSVGSVVKFVYLWNQFRTLSLGQGVSSTFGTPSGGYSWRPVTIAAITDSFNHVRLYAGAYENSSYGAQTELVENLTAFNPMTVIEGRETGEVRTWTGRPILVAGDDSSYGFDRTTASKLSRMRWRLAGADVWLQDVTGSNNDMTWKQVRAGVNTTFLQFYGGATPAVQAGDGAWDGVPFRLGAYRFWVDSSGRLRMKSGNPSSDTDGTIVGTQT